MPRRPLNDIIELSFGKRNVEGEMILEVADALNLVDANTWFKKERRLITYESGECRTVVDYILSRKSERKIVRNVKVVNVGVAIDKMRHDQSAGPKGVVVETFKVELVHSG